MCVMIIRDSGQVKYNPSIPLKPQIENSKEVIVNYVPGDSSVGAFVKEIENLIENGLSSSVNLKVNHNNNIFGLKTKKAIEKVKCDMKLNELIKLLVLSQKEVDKKLEDLMNVCKVNGR